MLAFIGMPGPAEIFILACVAVLLFGSRLPKLARDVGSSYNEFRRGLRDTADLMEDTQSEKA